MSTVYMYQAALYCEECGEKIRVEITAAGNAPEDIDDDYTYDSDDFPKRGDSGDEGDTPDHCDACGEFLENALTGDGVTYTEEIINRDIAAGRLDSVAVTTWLPFYASDYDMEIDYAPLLDIAAKLQAEIAALRAGTEIGR